MSRLLLDGPSTHPRGSRFVTCRCEPLCHVCGWGPHSAVHHWIKGHAFEPRMERLTHSAGEKP